MKIGFSTGCLFKTHDTLAPETIDILRKISTDALELMFHGVEDTEKFARLTKDDVAGFDYISVHAPIYRGEHQKEEYRKALRTIKEKQAELGFESVVLHPDMFDDFEMLKEFDLPYLVENMDSRKRSCKNVSDLEKVFSQLENAGFLLDINHAYTNDPSIKLADELLGAFGDKLEEIHLSGFDTFHDPIFETKQDYFMEKLNELDVPIIIESIVKDTETAKKEYNYIKRFVEGK